MSVNFNNSGDINHIKYDNNYIKYLYYNDTCVWAERVGTITYDGATGGSISTVNVYRTGCLDPNVTVYGIRRALPANTPLYYGDTLTCEITPADYWNISYTSASTQLLPAVGSDQTWNVFGIQNTTGIFPLVISTRVSRTLSVYIDLKGTLSVTAATVSDGSTFTVTPSTLRPSIETTCWAGQDISWKYSYTSLDYSKDAISQTNYRWIYYPTTYSGTISKGTTAVTISGSSLVTPQGPAYYTQAEFSSSTSDNTIAALPVIAASGSKTKTILKSLNHLYLYATQGVRVIGTCKYGTSVGSMTTRDLDVYLDTSSYSGTYSITNVYGINVGYITITVASTSSGSGITFVIKNSTTSTMYCVITITDVQVNCFNAANPYPVDITTSATSWTYNNNQTVKQCIEFVDGTIYTSGTGNYSPLAYPSTREIAAGGTDSWNITDFDESASEAYSIDYSQSDLSWRTWNSYFRYPDSGDSLDNYADDES